MGLQAQMKTSLPWPFSMLTLLLGMAMGAASGMAVSAPFACGLLRHAVKHQVCAPDQRQDLPRVLGTLAVLIAFPAADVMQNRGTSAAASSLVHKAP